MPSQCRDQPYYLEAVRVTLDTAICSSLAQNLLQASLVEGERTLQCTVAGHCVPNCSGEESSWWSSWSVACVTAIRGSNNTCPMYYRLLCVVSSSSSEDIRLATRPNSGDGRLVTDLQHHGSTPWQLGGGLKCSWGLIRPPQSRQQIPQCVPPHQGPLLDAGLLLLLPIWVVLWHWAWWHVRPLARDPMPPMIKGRAFMSSGDKMPSIRPMKQPSISRAFLLCWLSVRCPRALWG